MKKNLVVLFSIITIILAWCTNSDAEKIDSENWISDEWSSVEQVFNTQIEDTQYIKDLEDYVSYDILLNTEGTPYISKISFDADFDEKSSLQWWLEFSWNNILKSKDLESMDITFDLEVRENQDNLEPIYSSWNITLLYQNDEMYANLHEIWLFMGEWNTTAKMYGLLWDMIKDKWIDLEVNNWWIIAVNKNDDIKIPYIIWTLKNILETQDVQSSADFLWSVAEMIDTINSHIDLWISTNELALISSEIEYSQLSDESIQKEFTGSFQWKDSAFDVSFIASRKWLEVHFYNIEEYDEDIQNYRDTDSEFYFSIQENKKSEYSIVFQSIKAQQKVVDLEWKIKYSDKIKYSANFILEPLEIIAWQKISWSFEWEMQKENLNNEENFPELSWEIMLFSEILWSL